jgi:hypothetical protein
MKSPDLAVVGSAAALPRRWEIALQAPQEVCTLMGALLLWPLSTPPLSTLAFLEAPQSEAEHMALNSFLFLLIDMLVEVGVGVLPIEAPRGVEGRRRIETPDRKCWTSALQVLVRFLILVLEMLAEVGDGILAVGAPR